MINLWNMVGPIDILIFYVGAPILAFGIGFHVGYTDAGEYLAFDGETSSIFFFYHHNKYDYYYEIRYSPHYYWHELNIFYDDYESIYRDEDD